MNMKPRFRAYIKDLDIMLYDVAVYPDETIGIGGHELEKALPKNHVILDDGIYFDDPENDKFELIMSLLCGDDWFWFEEGQYELMQFTGFQNKENDIYRKDIIRLEEDNDEGTEIFYLFVEWISEWGMWATLLSEEYSGYQSNGIEALDEPMFWTYTLEDTDSRKHFLCGNVFQNKDLLE